MATTRRVLYTTSKKGAPLNTSDLRGCDLYRGLRDGTPVYSETTTTGNVCYPWESRASVRRAAQRDGFKAVFVQAESPAILPAVLKAMKGTGQ